VTLDVNVFKEFFRFFEEVAIFVHLSMVSLPVGGLVSKIVGFLHLYGCLIRVMVIFSVCVSHMRSLA